MAKPSWGSAADGWPYEHFTFAASVATVPVVLPDRTLGAALRDPGWHTQTSGLLDLIIAGCSVSTLAAYHVRRVRLTRR